MVNFQLKTTRKFPKGKEPIHLWRFSTLLRALDVKGMSTGKFNKKVTVLSYKDRDNEALLWDCYELAKKNWKQKIKLVKHDFVENHEQAVVLNLIWTTLKHRFAKRKIGINNI